MEQYHLVVDVGVGETNQGPEFHEIHMPEFLIHVENAESIPLALAMLERRPKQRWTCAWVFTLAPCWEECSARRGGSLTFGPPM